MKYSALALILIAATAHAADPYVYTYTGRPPLPPGQAEGRSIYGVYPGVYGVDGPFCNSSGSFCQYYYRIAVAGTLTLATPLAANLNNVPVASWNIPAAAFTFSVTGSGLIGDPIVFPYISSDPHDNSPESDGSGGTRSPCRRIAMSCYWHSRFSS